MVRLEHFGIEPDLITMAKSLGGGMPIAAVTGRAEIMDAPGPELLAAPIATSTSCAAALAAIETIEKEGLLARSTLSESILNCAHALAKKWPLVGDVRGLAACAPSSWCAIPRRESLAIPRPRKSRSIATNTASSTVTAGTFNNVIRILVPLVVTDEQFDEVKRD